MVYALPYLLLISLYALLAWVWSTSDEKIRLRITIASVLIYTLFFGLRGYIGTDWYAYQKSFDRMQWEDFFVAMQDARFELGFATFTMVVKTIWDNFLFYQFACFLLSFPLLYRFLQRYTDNIPLAFFIFLVMSGMVMQINLYRNFFTILLLANAVPYLQDRKPIHYFALCGLATLFHTSSVAFFPLYFFLHRKISKTAFAILVLLGSTMIVGNVKFIIPIAIKVAGMFGNFYVVMIEKYMAEYSNIQGGISIGLLERLLTAGLIYAYYDRLQEMRIENRIFINLFLLYFITFAAFNEVLIIANRVSMLFIFSYWVLWGDLISCFFYKTNRYLFLIFIGAYSFLKTLGFMSYPYDEYDNVLTGTKSYNERLVIYNRNFDTSDF